MRVFPRGLMNAESQLYSGKGQSVRIVYHAGHIWGNGAVFQMPLKKKQLENPRTFSGPGVVCD